MNNSTMRIVIYVFSCSNNFNIFFLKIFIVFFSINWVNSYVGNTNSANWFLENTLVFIFLAFLIMAGSGAVKLGLPVGLARWLFVMV